MIQHRQILKHLTGQNCRGTGYPLQICIKMIIQVKKEVLLEFAIFGWKTPKRLMTNGSVSFVRYRISC